MPCAKFHCGKFPTRLRESPQESGLQKHFQTQILSILPARLLHLDPVDIPDC
jgi:hypothetical protein